MRVKYSPCITLYSLDPHTSLVCSFEQKVLCEKFLVFVGNIDDLINPPKSFVNLNNDMRHIYRMY